LAIELDNAETRVVRRTTTPVCNIKADRPWKARSRRVLEEDTEGTTVRRLGNLRLPRRCEDLPGDDGDVKS
jgi:hypothetical protein